MQNVPISGYNVESVTPVNGVFNVAGFVRGPLQHVTIKWEVDGSSGATTCEAWRGQYEIDCLTRAGYRILSISLV